MGDPRQCADARRCFADPLRSARRECFQKSQGRNDARQDLAAAKPPALKKMIFSKLLSGPQKTDHWRAQVCAHEHARVRAQRKGAAAVQSLRMSCHQTRQSAPMVCAKALASAASARCATAWPATYTAWGAALGLENTRASSTLSVGTPKRPEAWPSST